jgi:hypothetical protein
MLSQGTPIRSNPTATISPHLSTPMRIRSGSVRDSDATTPILVNDLNKIMEIELKDSIINNVTNLVETVFPNKCLPFCVDRSLLKSLSNVYGRNGWINPPNATEPAHAEWLNCIGNRQVMQ